MTADTFTVELVRTVLRVLTHRIEYPPRTIAKTLNTSKDVIEQLLRSAKHIDIDETQIHDIRQSIVAQFSNDKELSPLMPFLAEHNARYQMLIALLAEYMFPINESTFKKCSDYLYGTYICHKYTSGGDIITDILVIKPYNVLTRITTFCAYYKHRELPTIYNAAGYILPVPNGYYALCGVSHDMQDSPDPYFVIIEHPSYAHVSYLRGISLDTDEWQQPWASIVYCGRAPQGTDERTSEIFATRTLGEFTDSFQKVLKNAIGGGALRLGKTHINVEDQATLCDPLAHIVKTRA